MNIRKIGIIVFFTQILLGTLLVLNNAIALDITIEQGVENPIPVAIVPGRRHAR